MKKQMVTGIGCFAKPQTLSRVFKKIMQNYTLGEYNGIESESSELLTALVTGKADCYQSPAYEPLKGLENKDITGFYLALRNQRLILSIFARSAVFGQTKYTANLHEFTRMRQKRLH